MGCSGCLGIWVVLDPFGYGPSYGAESVKNVEFARNKRSSSEMNGTMSSLPYALGVSLERTRNGLPQV
jgi:hypothetical protein